MLVDPAGRRVGGWGREIPVVVSYDEVGRDG